MLQCKTAEKVDRFVQEVTCAPEPMAILATSQQLVDLERFCCDPAQFSVMGVDPTFDLGEFSVTLIVHQHLMVQNVRTKKCPWMLGPVLVHYRKEFWNYNFFFSSLIGLRPGLSHIKAVGTDGERAIIDALHQQFCEAQYLLCFRHLQKNIEHHLQAQGFPIFLQQQFLLEIFGETDESGTHQEGLVDCKDEDSFFDDLSELKATWDDRERRVFGQDHQPLFHNWFCKYKAEDFCEGTLSITRELAGLGCPPLPYYTNPNESINSALKTKVDYTKQQWLKFNDLMKAFVTQQSQEVEQAIIGGGKYELKEQYKSLDVSKQWWTTTEEQRKLH